MKKERNSKWTKDAIFKAFDKYIEENGRLPNSHSIDEINSLPTHSSIKNRFGLTTKQFYKKYYPQYVNLCKSDCYHYNTKSFWKQDFIKQYKRMGTPTTIEYDKMRDCNTPCVIHLKKILEVKSWDDLLQECDLIEHNEISYKIDTDNLDYSSFYDCLENLKKRKK